MTFIKNLYHDEIREDVLVKSNLKKVWNRQLEIWAEVDRICRRHGITYWAIYGTLLGAARHKGFIPWDEDVDLCMMRPEFNRFINVLDELNESFVAQNLDFDTLKIFHTQTTLIFGRDFSRDKPSGLMLDIFALDVLEDGTPESSFAVAALKELYKVIWDSAQIGNCDGLLNDLEFLQEAAALAEREYKIKLLQLYAENLFNQSQAVEWFDDTLNHRYKQPFRKEWFDETIYLPFETIELPAPKKFDEILTSYYGDWRTPVRDGQPRLGFIHSPDIPYKDFWRQADMQALLRKKIQGGLDNWLS